MRHNINAKYRICHKCGKEWNVSANVRGDKHYICPCCTTVKRGENNAGPDKLFLNAEDVVKIMGVAKPTAYKLMQRLNSELAKKGYITIQGKVPTKYFFERCGLIETAK